MSGIVNDTARLIRRVDGDNTMPAAEVGHRLAGSELLTRAHIIGADLAAFLQRTNPDKRMGSGHLAELIVAEFDLDKEER